MANVRNMGSVATLGTKSITANGTYNASSDNLDGFSQVSVNVPEAVLGTKNITENGTYNASSDNLDGYNQVNVNVPEAVLGTKSITENGTYNASSDNLDGYSQVLVNVPLPSGRMIDYSSRLYSGWYIGSNTYKLDSEDPHAVTMSWPVESGHTYIIMSGTTNAYVPTRHRYGFANADLVANPVEAALSGYFEDNITTYNQYYGIITAPINGYLIGYIGLPATDNGMIVYLVDITGKDISGHIN